MLGVTLFGIFLTPVFFSIIEWLAEFSIFEAVSVRWLGSALVGGLAGLAVGFLAWKVGFDHRRWALLCGFGLGTLTALVVLRRLRARTVRSSTSPRPQELVQHPATARSSI
jgi:multidrug efflux pump